jgi:hypothetical protein
LHRAFGGAEQMKKKRVDKHVPLGRQTLEAGALMFIQRTPAALETRSMNEGDLID